MKFSVTKMLALQVGTTLAGFLLISGIAHVMMQKVYDSANNATINAVPSLVVLGELRKNFDQVRLLLYRHTLAENADQMTSIEQQLTQFRHKVDDSLRQYETNGCLGITCIADDTDKDYLYQEKNIHAKFEQLIEPILQESRKSGYANTHVKAPIETTAGLAEEMSQTIDKHFDYNALLAKKFSDEGATIKTSSLNLMAALDIVLFALISLFAAFIARSILRLLGGEPDVAASLAAQLAVGDVSGGVELKPGDTTSLMAKIDLLGRTMGKIARRADAVRMGNLTDKVDILSDKDTLGIAINDMVNSLRIAKETETRRSWIVNGNSQLAEILTGDFSLQEIADSALSVIARYLNAGRGVLYLIDTSNEKLELVGSYMFTERPNLANHIKLGEGAIGQVAREKKPIILTTYSAEAAPILTGTTCANPFYTYSYPLQNDGNLLGVVELGTFEKFDEVKLEFLQTATNELASALTLTKQREQIRILYEASERAEREVRAQNASLQEINARMEEQQQQLQQQAEELQQSNAQMEEQQQQLQQQSEELQQSNAQMEEQQKLLLKNNEELRLSQAKIDEKAGQLELSNQYKSEFLANMSHELRTPLNAIILLSKMLSENRNKTLGESEIKYAEVIHRSGGDLLNLINDVLDLSKVDSGHMDLNLHDLTSTSILSELKDLFTPMAQDRGIEFIITDQFQNSIVSDPGKISQIVRNLLSNAFKFTKSGSVRLQFEHHPSQSLPICIKVKDSGIGIPADKLATIFEAFRQVDGSTSREYGGTGLGLTISLRLAQLLGGTITVSSVPGEGSEFALHLPLRASTESLAPEITVKPLPSKDMPEVSKNKSNLITILDDRENLKTGDKVFLLIDDDQAFAAAIVDINHQLGYKTVVAMTGQQGMELVKTVRPAGILLDLGLPDMDGMELLDKLKTSDQSAAIPVYVISARDRDATIIKNQIVGYLQKPVTNDDIEDAESLLLAAISHDGEGGILVVNLVSNSNVTTVAKLKTVLEDENYQARFVGSASDTASALTEQTWGVVIIILSELTVREGLTLAGEVRRVSPGTAMVFCATDHLTDQQDADLRSFTDCIISNPAQSGRRLLDNIRRFLTTTDVQENLSNVENINRVGGKRLAKYKILVIDDDPRNLFVITAALEQEGARVSTAINGKVALDLLKKEKFHLIFTDIMMPVMDGYQTIKAIRANPQIATIPIVALTAKAMSEDRESILEVGADDYLAKPVEYDMLNNLAVLWCSKAH